MLSVENDCHLKHCNATVQAQVIRVRKQRKHWSVDFKSIKKKNVHISKACIFLICHEKTNNLTDIFTVTPSVCPRRSLVLRCWVLLVPLAAGLVNFNQQVFDILDFTFYRLCLVPQLPVPPFKAMQLFLQRI